MGKKKDGVKGPPDPATWKTKSKCCRSKPRCKKCPVVLDRLKKAGAFDAKPEAFKKALKVARRW